MSTPAPPRWRPRRAAIIGIGLLGGSVGLALRRAWPDLPVVGVARNQATLSAAMDIGAATEVTDDLSAACRDCDLVLVATPVDLVAAAVCQAAEVTAANALITDVGSTKAKIVSTVASDSRAAKLFVGSHPIAGSEKSGPQHASSELFRGRLVVVTPGPDTSPSLVERATALWNQFGGRVTLASPAEHDRLLAATSHLPHLVAAAMAALLPPEADSFAGSGWRDTTRVASGSAEIWSAICLDNAVAIEQELQRMITQLQHLRSAVADGDSAAIEQLLLTARASRNRVNAQLDAQLFASPASNHLNS